MQLRDNRVQSIEYLWVIESQTRRLRAISTPLKITPLPYVAVYRVRSDYIEIARVLHGAEQWPD